ncbi:MAG TPA: TlpA family protein disulfide reductase [Candidatus Acetothermia bacterium]|nr:TlpA family protein disulfide reductase [Candidatus Acetothermia bacterium]
MTDQKKLDEKADNGRWLMVLVVVVLVAVAGVIAWSVASHRTNAPKVAQTGDTSTNEVPAAPASSTTASSSTATSAPASAVTRAPAPAAPEGITVGKSAPDFTLKDLDGNSVSLHQFRGHVVILDFWASWCAPCRASMPTLDGFAAKYHDKGLVMIGVSLDRSAGDASSFLKGNNYHRLIALWGSVSASQGVARTYGVSGIPHTFVIDPDGIIRFVNHPMRLTESFLDSLFQ